jgi:acetyltransferase-like isoleucine patch superfamily enzyme
VDGVVIRTGSILGAGSLAHKKIPSYSVALGNPATVIKKR